MDFFFKKRHGKRGGGEPRATRGSGGSAAAAAAGLGLGALGFGAGAAGLSGLGVAPYKGPGQGSPGRVRPIVGSAVFFNNYARKKNKKKY